MVNGNVPIILLITSVLYNENEEKYLPERKTELYENLYEFIMDRSALKPNNFGLLFLQTSKPPRYAANNGEVCMGGSAEWCQTTPYQ